MVAGSSRRAFTDTKPKILTHMGKLNTIFINCIILDAHSSSVLVFRNSFYPST